MPAERDRRRAALRLLAVPLGVSLVCWWLGTDVWHAITFGVVLSTLGAIVGGVTGPTSEPADWADTRRRTPAGSRGDVAELGRALRGERGRVSGAAAWRVTQLAQRRLAARGLDLDDPAQRDRIQALIGRRSYRVLTRGRGRPPRLGALTACLDALDALEALDPPILPEAP